MLDMNAPPPSAPPTVAQGARSNASPPPSARSLTSGWGTRGNNPEDAYQFEMLPSIESHALPKRVTQGGKKKKKAEGELNPRSPLTPREGGAMASVLGGKKPMSPSRLGRSVSPRGHLPKPTTMHLMADPNKYQLDSGKMMDMSSAYRRLSDAALLRSGGSLADLGKRKPSDASKSGEILSPRLEKDYLEDEALESSDAEDTDSSSEDGWGSERRRGRSTRPKSLDGDSGAKKPKSLLAAAEDERKDAPPHPMPEAQHANSTTGKSISSTYRVRSLLGSEPSVTVTGPDGEKTTQKKTGVHPNTSFDTGHSGINTPVDSDAEENLSDIRRAQRLAMSIGPITTSSEACRCVRMIVRGEYSSLQREAELGLRRQRVYLVATDLSEEAAYALEWTIGTVLRDGDTMLAVYAVDDEMGTGAPNTDPPGTPGLTKASNSGLEIGQGSAEAETLVKTLSHDGTQLNPRAAMASLNEAAGSRPASPGPQGFGKMMENGELDLASMSRPERESYLATKEVGERCVKLLRKTKLQVRVVVEVFRSKSPRHTLTEVVSQPVPFWDERRADTPRLIISTPPS
jgi:hypothetical protein